MKSPARDREATAPFGLYTIRSMAADILPLCAPTAGWRRPKTHSNCPRYRAEIHMISETRSAATGQATDGSFRAER